VETAASTPRARSAPATSPARNPAAAASLAGDRWVIDGVYRRKLGDLVLAAAETVVWLDLPVNVWLPRWFAVRGSGCTAGHFVDELVTVGMLLGATPS